MSGSGVTERYRRFAEVEAAGRSAVYERLAFAIAEDERAVALIDGLPVLKQQPNLVLAAARYAGLDLDADRFTDDLAARWSDVRSIVLTRSTQTNEAGRCAVLLPSLAALDGPLALIEVGASAGLCLVPDRYSYRYRSDIGVVALDPVDGVSPVVLEVEAFGPVPDRLPEVVWRAGIELNPLDVRDPDEVAWLETLVWPGQEERAARLRTAAALVAQDPPLLVRGDAIDRLEALVDAAPNDATVVVFHSAVLAYFSAEARQAFVSLVRSLLVTWVSNEGASVLPEVAGRLREVARDDEFIVAVDGEPVLLADPHGRYYRRAS